MNHRPFTELAQAAVSALSQAGDTLVDATVGNGHDTLFLARIAGATGKVFGFDVQATALAATQTRLNAAGLANRAELLEQGHENLASILQSHPAGQPSAIMFNLGYLPGADKARCTRPDTTRMGIQQALQILRPGGVLTVVAYPGHPDGAAEAQTVAMLMRDLDPERFHSDCQDRPNTRNPAPVLWVVHKQISQENGCSGAPT